MNPRRDEVRALRRRGLSYQEISKRLGVARSSIHYMVQGIVLTRKQIRRLLEKQRANWRTLNKRWQRRSTSEEMRQKQRETMLDWWRKLDPDRREALRNTMRDFRAKQHKRRNPSRVPRTLDRRTYRMCLRVAPRLGYHPNWNYVMSRGNGYFAVQCPDHPHGTPRGYVPVHRVVTECKLKRLLKRSEVVHHKNRNNGDNSVENVCCTTNANHSKIHARPTVWTDCTCGWCGKLFRRAQHDCHPTKSGLLFCSRSCGAHGGHRKPS